MSARPMPRPPGVWVLALIAGLIIAGVAIGVLLLGVARPGGDMAASLLPGQSPSAPTPAASQLPMEDVPGRDPVDLPRFPGSVRTHFQRTTDDGLEEVVIRYAVVAELPVVRAHYRAGLADHGWFVGNAEFEEDSWRFTADRQQREVSLLLTAKANRVAIELSMSEPLDGRTPRGDDDDGGGGGGGGDDDDDGGDDDDDEGDEG